MKYIKKYDAYLLKEEEGLMDVFKSATGAFKNFLGGITTPFKNLSADFKKGMKLSEVKNKVITSLDQALKSATDNINKAKDENEVNQMKDAFRKEVDEKMVEFDNQIKSIKESRLINENAAKDALIGGRVMFGMLKDTMSKMKADFDVKYAAAKDLAAKKSVAIAEIKAIIENFKKKIADETQLKQATDKYKADNKIEGSKNTIILDWGDVEVEIESITSSKDENLKKEYPTHYIVVKSGSKKLLEGDLVKLSSDVKKGVKVKMTEIIRGGKPLDSMKEYETGTLERIVVGDKEVEEYKVEEGNQDEELKNVLGKIKDDKEKMKQVLDFAKNLK
jgi:hypothetical protein